MIRTFEEAFQQGYDAPCEHGVPDPNDCPSCKLTPEEITRLALVWGPSLRAAAARAEAEAG